MKNEQMSNTVGWQMRGATPRTAAVGGWTFTTVAVPPAPVRCLPSRHDAPKVSARRMTRLLPVLAVAGVLTTLAGGVAVARYPHNTSLSAASVYPMNVAVTVQNGDTLWSLAKHYGSEDRYILEQVDEIAQANNMSAKVALLPGQRVWIPAHDEAERTFITARRLTR